MTRLSAFLCAMCASAVALFAFTNYAEAQCDPRAFLVQEMKDIRATGETELAFVLTASQEEFDQAKKSGALSGSYGLISGSGSYAEAKEKAVRIAQATKFDYRSSYATSYFSQTYSARAIAAYESCLNHKSAGLPIWLRSREGDFLTFEAFWVGRNLDDANANYDAPPLVKGGTLVSKPEKWTQGKTEQIVIERTGNGDVFLQLKVGGETNSKVIVRDPPQVVWDTQPVTSDTVMKTCSHGPNPGCSAGQVGDCIHPKHPGGYFVQKTRSVTQFSSSDPGRYSEQYDQDTPAKVCVKITQSTGACEVTQCAQGRLTANETFPRAAE
ncbi:MULTISPECIES: hypothetical protein [Bradyrhizobium]|uniref:hypothetical protein n=1 Tax=Bradyrhizobium TaxID=374 RepID=UPI001008F454|nr:MULTISPECIES: hypothetical protein [Bradyrhizobium]MDA9399709.1 hypothetical protein [Bradyrhizobium sp. CCBAU 45389]MDA9433515.1 hypothetical protein [Bradyrhizobium sp. CCBAU 51627]MDA9531383.1 hypothetical protein [Bradyrhizobium sp. CCBAU 25338]RXH32316.1 hypothetical protein XH84_14020 [Bradyrhizobium nanningense]